MVEKQKSDYQGHLASQVPEPMAMEDSNIGLIVVGCSLVQGDDTAISSIKKFMLSDLGCSLDTSTPILLVGPSKSCSVVLVNTASTLVSGILWCF